MISLLDLDRGVHLGRGSPTDEQRNIKAFPFHLFGNVHHLLEGWRDESAQSDDICPFVPCGLQDLGCRHHHTEVDDLVVVAAEYHAHDVLADVVDVSLDRGDHELAVGPPGFTARGAFPFDERHQMRHCLFHDAGALYNLGEKHPAAAEQIAHDVHAIHQGAFDHLDGAIALLPRLLRIFHDVVENALYESVGEPFLYALIAPLEVIPLGLYSARDSSRQLGETLGGLGPAVEQNVLDGGEEILGDVVVHRQLTRVDDAHVHAGTDGMVQE